ncbi:MAG: glycosyltransferase family 4 protein [Nitrospinota bacterium]
MRIVLDARMWRWTGIGTYVQVLLEGFAEILPGGLGEARPEHEIICLVGPSDMSGFPPPGGPAETFRKVACNARVYSPWEMRGLAKTLRSLDFDLVHFPHYVHPYRANFPAVVTIHDLIHLRFPSYHKTPLHYAYARHVLPRSARAAKRIITVSSHSKEDIVSRLGVPPEKVAVIHNGLAKHFTPEPDGDPSGGGHPQGGAAAERVKRAFGLAGPYVLYVGNAKGHKNLHGLLRAFRRLTARMEHEKGGEKPPALALTVRRGDLRGEAARVGLEGVRFLGHVSGDHLVDLYRAAAVFAFPSYYEGFGYPPLEAMACGTPVVCSNAASLPEVVGEAAIQVPPDNLDRLSSALYDLLTKEELRVRLRSEGVKRSRTFSARDMAEATLRVYQEVLGG